MMVYLNLCFCFCIYVNRVIDLVVHMGDEGLLPDNQLLSAVARAIATFNTNNINDAAAASDTINSNSNNNNTDNLLKQSTNLTSTAVKVAAAAVIDPHHAVSGGLEISPSEVWVLQYNQWEAMYRGTCIMRYIYFY